MAGKFRASHVGVMVISAAVTTLIVSTLPTYKNEYSMAPIRSSRMKKVANSAEIQQPAFFNLMEENYRRYDPNAKCTLDYINEKKLPQDHPCVIELAKKLLKEPSPRLSPYNLTYSETSMLESSRARQPAAVMRLLNNQTGGYFVECGAADGEALSNTLFLEGNFNWTGLLIEPDPQFFNILSQKINRKSWKANVCLSPEKYPMEVSFESKSLSGKILRKKANENKVNSENVFKVQCFPFYSLLLALERTNIDYFSLDVEGQELAVLRTVPWHKVDIKILTVEWEWVEDGQRAVIDFMKRNGYILFGNVATQTARDNVFVKDFLSDLRPDYEIFYPDEESPYAEEIPLLTTNT